MAVGDVFKKRRNLVQSAASKPRAGYGARVNAFKVEPTGNPMRDWAEAERAATGSINRMQPGQAGQAWGQAQRDWAEQERGATLGWGEQPSGQSNPMVYLSGNAGMTGAYRQNQPVYFQGVDPRTGQVSRVPISHKQMSAFNNPFLGSGDMGRPEDGSIAPVAGGPRSFNPQNQGDRLNPMGTTRYTDDQINEMQSQSEGRYPSWMSKEALATLATARLNDIDRDSQNQDVLARASAALDAVKQDRLNPMYGGAQGYAAPGQNVAIQGSPGLRGFVNSVGSGLASAYNSVASALTAPPQMYNGPMENVRPERLSDLQDTPGFRFSWNGAGAGDVPNLADALNDPQPSNPVRSGYAPTDRGPVPRSVASQAPNYYQQQAAGMDVESIRRRELAGQIDALRQRSQRDNPMAPQAPAYDPMQAEIDRGTRQGNIMFEPGATSSSGATRNFRKIPTEDLNSTTAGTVNGYNGNVGYARNPMRLDPETKLNLAEGNARRIVGGGAAADPTNMRGRFGGAYGTGLNADATAIAEGRAVRTADGNVVYHTGTQESAQKAYMSARANGYGRTPEQEAARHAKAVEQATARAAKHQAFKDANGGMSYRQYDRMTGSSNGNNALTMKAVREGRLSPEEANYRMQLRAEKALRRSGNPITGGTSQAGKLFPDQMVGRGGNQSQAGPNPLSAATDTFRPNGIVTPDSRQAAQNTLKVMAEGGDGPDGTKVPPSPMFAGLADSPDNIQGLHFGVQQMVQDGQDLGADDLRKLHAATVAMQAGYGSSSYDPFDMTYGAEAEGMFGSVDTEHTKVFGPMYKQLAEMKAPTNEALLGWWQSFKGNIRPDTNRFFGGSAILSGEGAPTVSPGGYEYPLRPKKDEPFLRNPMK